jgi:reversibly glycosylated polypeptide/UDP-arabinopyranose mutase
MYNVYNRPAVSILSFKQMKTAVVVPTIRPDRMKKFMKAWRKLFDKHQVELLIVKDGENPTVNGLSAGEVMDKYADCLTNFSAAIRNLGFAYVARRLPDVEVIITLDDDETPVGDPIQDHINALQMRVPVSWMATASEYMRGFPYGVRDEAEVVLSHGVWKGVADWDAQTQLSYGNRPVSFYKGPIPKGVYFPMCAMNLAFKIKMLPYIYHAPRALGMDRFEDIFAGIVSKREIDKNGWAAVSGYSIVNHKRASNVLVNLKKEALGIKLNENFWTGDESHPYFKIYRQKLKRWQEFVKKYV